MKALNGATIEEIISVKREIISSNDHTINWDAPAEDIVDAVAEVEEAVYPESSSEEETLPTTIIKDLHEVLASLQNLKGYIESQGANGEVILAILQVEMFLEREVLISKKVAQLKKVTDFPHSV